MGLGILDDHALEHVPGTAHVLSGEARREQERRAAETTGGRLKYAERGGKGSGRGRGRERERVLLVPQPSDDPNDPLVRVLISISIVVVFLVFYYIG